MIPHHQKRECSTMMYASLVRVLKDFGEHRPTQIESVLFENRVQLLLIKKNLEREICFLSKSMPMLEQNLQEN